MQKNILILSKFFKKLFIFLILFNINFSFSKNFLKRKLVFNKRTKDYLDNNVKSLSGLLAEVAMDKADKYLNFNRVPKIKLIYTIDNKSNHVFSCYSHYIEPKDVSINNSYLLRKLISDSEWSEMNIFCFLFGQYDRHFGNVIISKFNNKLYLIDNEAVVNTDQFVQDYSPDRRLSFPWVPIKHSYKLLNKLKNKNNSLTKNNLLEAIFSKLTKSNIELMHKEFYMLDEWTHKDIDRGACVVYKGTLWRQMYLYSANLLPSFSEFISPELFNKLKNLDIKKLMSFWPELPKLASEKDKETYQELIYEFSKKTLIRRDLIINYFNKHPESIRDLNFRIY